MLFDRLRFHCKNFESKLVLSNQLIEKHPTFPFIGFEKKNPRTESEQYHLVPLYVNEEIIVDVLYLNNQMTLSNICFQCIVLSRFLSK